MIELLIVVLESVVTVSLFMIGRVFLINDAMSVEGQAMYYASLTAQRLRFEKLNIEMDCDELY